jgi:hypothetical protein
MRPPPIPSPLQGEDKGGGERRRVMRFLKLVWVIVFSTLALTYALDYIESSSGLDNPALDGGRTELEMADINGDGNIDILSIGDHGSPYVNTQEHGIMVWFGDGQGNWSVYQNGNFGYGGIAIGDINNDGFLDAGYGMHHNYSSTDFGDSILEAALGDGTGQNWTPWDDGISTAGDWGMFCTDFGDINNDGYLDLGSASFGCCDGIHIVINNGDGTWYESFGFLGGNSTMDFMFGDVNADGHADFVAAHQYGSVYLGDGNGNFTLADGNLPPAGNVGRRGPSIGDVDNDGDQDFAFRNSNGGVEVWIWQGSNTWADFSGNLPNSGPYYGTQISDMNVDGFMDVAAFGDSTITVWFGNGAGNWTEATTFYTPGPGDYAAFRVGADADHNGYPDIVLEGEEGTWPSSINKLHFFKETSTPGSLFVVPIYPRGGETFIAGSVHFIRWTCGVPSGDIATIKLEISINGSSGPYTEIVAGIPNNCMYQWSIPTGISSDNCYIRYTATTATDTSLAITPTSFRISPSPGVKEFDVLSFEKMKIEVMPTVSAQTVLINISSSGSDNKYVKVYDNCGKLVKKLFEIKGSGEFTIYWDKKDDQENEVSAGIYFITLETEKEKISKKVVLVE